jgi:hypothetical protein
MSLSDRQRAMPAEPRAGHSPEIIAALMASAARK